MRCCRVLRFLNILEMEIEGVADKHIKWLPCGSFHYAISHKRASNSQKLCSSLHNVASLRVCTGMDLRLLGITSCFDGNLQQLKQSINAVAKAMLAASRGNRFYQMRAGCLST